MPTQAIARKQSIDGVVNHFPGGHSSKIIEIGVRKNTEGLFRLSGW